MTEPLLKVDDLRVAFSTARGEFEAVKGVSFEVLPGETLAIVGESGSGKSTIAASLNRLLASNGRISGGSVRFDGAEITTMAERDLNGLRGAQIGLVPQDPMSNLNPMHRIGDQILEVLRAHGAGGENKRQRVVELLEMVGIPDAEQRIDQYPHEFSGGMRQRVLIAMGLACQPRLLIADEPTSALDVTVQRRVLDRLDALTEELGASVILITHDLPLAVERADRVLVMYRGEVVEQGAAKQILEQPKHEYTKRLVEAAPSFMTTSLVEKPAAGAAGSGAADPEPFARVTGLGKSYRIRGQAEPFWAAREVSFTIPRGRTVSIVGESGSGKSTTARVLLGLEDATEGTVEIAGDDISTLKRRELMGIRRKVQPVFQNPFASLDPRYTVAELIEEPLKVHRIGSRAERAKKVAQLLDDVMLAADYGPRYPHQLSGGQRQRVAIARALALDPDLVVLDEAVSALDVLVQAQILELLTDLQRDLGLSYLFISHDLAVVRMISHEVHVMQRGRIVESGTPEQIFEQPQAECTRELLAAIPGLNL